MVFFGERFRRDDEEDIWEELKYWLKNPITKAEQIQRDVEINTKAQGQMNRLSMIVDTINQDFIVPNVEKVAKLCADFKSGVETIFVNKENKQEIIEIDDTVRQGEYKYKYSDASNTTLKSEQADILVQAVEKFSQKIQLNLEEIFIWFFEQKGVENPERFLASGANPSVLPQLPLQNLSDVGLNPQIAQDVPVENQHLNSCLPPDFY